MSKFIENFYIDKNPISMELHKSMFLNPNKHKIIYLPLIPNYPISKPKTWKSYFNFKKPKETDFILLIGNKIKTENPKNRPVKYNVICYTNKKQTKEFEKFLQKKINKKIQRLNVDCVDNDIKKYKRNKYIKKNIIIGCSVISVIAIISTIAFGSLFIYMYVNNQDNLFWENDDFFTKENNFETVKDWPEDNNTRMRFESEPEVTEQEPEVTEQEPEVTEQEPEVTKHEPETSSEPEVTEQEPEVTEQEPEVTEPETSSEPEVTKHEPETSSEPEVTEPETSSEPEVTEPETSSEPEVTEPETSSEPEVTEQEPEVTLNIPNINIFTEEEINEAKNLLNYILILI